MFKYTQSLNDNDQFLTEKDKFLYNFSKFEDMFARAYTLEKPLNMTKFHLTDRWSPNNTVWTMNYDAESGVHLWVHIEFTPDVLYIGDFEHREECDGHDCEEWNCGVLGEEIELKEQGELTKAEKLISVGLSPDATREEIYVEMKKAEQNLAEAVLEFEEAPAKTSFTEFKASPLAAKFSYYNESKPHSSCVADGFYVGNHVDDANAEASLRVKLSYNTEYKPPHWNCIKENGLHVGRCIDERFMAFHNEPHGTCTIKDYHHVGACKDKRYSVFYNHSQPAVVDWSDVKSATEEVVDKYKNVPENEQPNYSYFT